MTDYDSALSAVRAHVADLGVYLAAWERRREPDAVARRSASAAVDAIDACLGELYGLRATLISEIRQADVASAARADALLRLDKLSAAAAEVHQHVRGGG